MAYEKYKRHRARTDVPKPLDGQVDKDACLLRFKGNREKTPEFGAQAFYDYYDIPHEETKAYIAKWNEEAGIIEIQL